MRVSTVVATVAVLVTWSVVALVIAGVGVAIRRGMLALVGLAPRPTFCAPDIWTGMAALTAYLLLWSVLAAVGPATWIAPLAVGAGGLALLFRAGIGRPRLGLMTIPLLMLVVWLANLSLGPAHDYDSGLYHFGAIEYAEHSAAIPGLGNLQFRLATGAAHFLFVAFLGIRPWSDAGHHLANGLLVSLLVVHIWTIIGRSDPALRGSMSWRLALLAVPAIVIVVAMGPTYLVSGPGIDFPVFVLVIAAGIALAQAFERHLDMRFVVGGVAALATGAASRPQVVPALVVAIGIVLIATRLSNEQGLRSRAFAALALPFALALGLAGRQTILSGYPLWPSGLLAMPVDWRVSREVLTDYRDEVQAWARWPGHTPHEVGSWGDWIGRWAESTLTNGAVTAALVLIVVAAVLPLAFRSEPDRADRRARAGAAAVVLIPSAAALVIWFVVAPDVRFAFGWIWLLGIGLVAWLAPAPTGLGARLLPVLAILIILGIGMAHAFMSNPIDLRVPAVGDGPFGSVLPDTTETRSFTTGSGLRLVVPVRGDQCWQVLWCTPYPNPRLTQRGRRLQDGFSVSGR